MGPPANLPSATIRPRDWTEGHDYATLRAGFTDAANRVILVDGVSYTAAAVSRMVYERHVQATEIAALRRRLAQNATHLQRRTAALVRLIAAKDSSLSGDG
jgi:hypothetical protein